MTDGSFVELGVIEDVERGGQSLSMIEGGRLWERGKRKFESALLSARSKN